MTISWWAYSSVIIIIALVMSLLYRHYMTKTLLGINDFILEIVEDAKKEIIELEKEFAEAQKTGNELRKLEISQRIYDLKKGNGLL
jgi:hypothetical protein